MRSGLFALGALFSTASQLRFGSSPVGPGELCLVLWLGLTMIEPMPKGGMAIDDYRSTVTAPRRHRVATALTSALKAKRAALTTLACG